MYTETLKEVLMPFNSKELEHFNEATKDCSPERKLSVAKRIAQEKLPDGWQFTEAAIRRFVAEEGLRKATEQFYLGRGIKINDGADHISDTDSKLKEIKERQFKAYRAGGLSEAEARGAAGLTTTHEFKESNTSSSHATTDDRGLKEIKERQFKAYRASGFTEAEARTAAGL
jgi:hypothetical protein